MSDTFRQNYKELTQEQIDNVRTVKSLADDLNDEIERQPKSRELSLALTKLEECVMWAVKGITK